MRDFKVLVVFGNIPLLGQERGNIQVFSALKETGIQSLFITHWKYGYLTIQPVLDSMGLEWTKATFPGLFSRGMDVKTWFTRIRELIQGLRDFWKIHKSYRPTHIHFGNEGHFINLLPVLWLTRTPVIFRLGDAPRNHRFIFRLIWKWFIIPRVSQFICISNFIKQLLLDAGAPEDKIRVIYNFPPDRPADTVAAGETLPAPFEGFTFVYIGQLSKEKGVDLLIDAAIAICSERSDTRFLIAGDYSWNNPFAHELMNRIQALGLSQRIRFLGYINDIPELLSISNVHICPSVIKEGLGNVVLEAKKAGVPSIVFPSGGLPELVMHSQDGFICKEKTASALIDGINYYLHLGSASIRNAGEQARLSLEHLGITRPQFTAAWLAVYEQVSKEI